MTAWIGLTGGIGSGKSQAAAYFSALGVPIIDADAINSQLISTPNSPALIEIKQHFGTQALKETGILNRTYIRDLIFRQPEKKTQLENILHPQIIHNIQQQQQHTPASQPYGIVEIPTLTENQKFQQLIQRILLIHCDEAQRIARVQARSQLDEATIRAIIANQATDKQRLTIADDVIDNSTDLQHLQQSVEKQHQHYLKYYATTP